MKCVTSILLLCAAASVASAIRVPPSWEEEQDYESYKSKLRKTRQKSVLERRMGGFAQANHQYKTKKPHISKDVPVIPSDVKGNPIIIPLDGRIGIQPVYQVVNENTPNPRFFQSNQQNDWIPSKNRGQYLLSSQRERPNIQYNGAIRNTVINEETPMYQRWQESKGSPKIKSKNNRYKVFNKLAEDDLIRQLEKHKIIQKNVAALDKSPGKLRSIYLEDQLNRKAINHNNEPFVSGTKIDTSEITFTTTKPEVSRSNLKNRPSTHRNPKLVKNTKEASENEIEKRQRIILANHREGELHEPYKDTSERDDTLHEPKNFKDMEEVDENKEEKRNKENIEVEEEEDNKENVKEKDENVLESEVKLDKKSETEEENEDTEEEDATSEEENEESNEEPVKSEHANPINIQTKPIYPGEGQWARPGKKYRPYISQHRFVSPDDSQEKKPDGYDVFEELSKYFDNQRTNFERQGQFSPADNMPTNRVPTFGEQLQAELPTPPPNTWRPNHPNQINPVNPIIVYDPFNEPSENIATTLSPTSRLNIQTKPANHNPEGIKQFEVQESQPDEKEDGYSDQKENNDTSDTKEHDESSEDETNEENEEKDQEDEDLEIDPESVSEEIDEEDDDEDFTPMQLYTQVRHSANVEHLPSGSEETGRLKEVIRDSKVQTVYTEEGYEDLAYDHAGHEKKAESDEGFAKFEKDKEEKTKLVADGHAKNYGKKEVLDSVPLNTDFMKQKEQGTVSEEALKIPVNTKKNSNNFLSTKQVKTTELKEKGNGKLLMEIQNEIKTVMQPNNSETAQTSLKIYPRIYQDLRMEDATQEDLYNIKPITEKVNDHQNITEITKGVMFNQTTTNFSATTAYGIDKTEMPYVTIDSNSDSTNDNNISNKRDQLFGTVKQTTTISSVQIENKNSSEDISSTESYITKEYFDPETDNFDVEDISVKSVADIFLKMKKTNPRGSEILSKEEQRGTSQLDKIEDQFKKSIVALKRQKRGSGFLNVNVDTDFIDNIDHTLPSKPPNYDSSKYPYYKDVTISENSPLHYAETLQNIPKKVEGKLSFYEKAEEMECPDLDEPDPIPDHVKNRANGDYNEYEDEENNKKINASKTPKIELTNKIKCYKKRYFGDNPLDSPFFKEEFVGPVKPIFKELTKTTDTLSRDSEVRGSAVIQTVDKANEIFNKLDKDIKQKYLTDIKNKEFAKLLQQTKKTFKNPIQENQNEFDAMVELVQGNSGVERNMVLQAVTSQKNIITTTTTSTTLNPTAYDSRDTSTIKSEQFSIYNSTPVPLPALITTPKYTLKLTPKNIYDQITFLDHLDTSGTEFLPLANLDIDTMPIEANRRESKSLKDENEEENITIEPQPLRRRRRPQNGRRNYHIILNRRGMTTTPISIIDTKPTTVLPKYKVISEVFYKDEIQPNEQLAVFSDILNNIRNASKLEAQVQMQSTSNFAEPSAVTISTIDTHTKTAQRENPLTKTKKLRKDSSDQIAGNSPKYKISTSRPINVNIVKLLKNKTPKYSSQIRQTLLNKPVRSQKLPVEQRDNKPVRKNSQLAIDFIEETEEIIGLVPPEEENYNTIVLDNIIEKGDTVTSSSVELPIEHLYKYKTIILPTSTEQIPAPVSENIPEPIVIQLNKYLFLGLKPPRPQKVRPYTDFVLNNDFARRKDIVKHQRYRREAQRPAYSELSRNRGKQEEILDKPDVTDDDADDYVPHRPRNYYYDERTGKIVYLNKSKQQTQEEEEDMIEYEEVTESRLSPELTTPKSATKLLLATAKPPPPGEGFMDFLSKLRNDPNYKFIPDPTTTEKGSVSAVTEMTSPRPTVSTNPPEFLSILAKIKSDSSYKTIKDPDNNKNKKISTTTEAPLEEENEEEEEDARERLKDVRNKSGIFDITGYLPEIKEYIPKTKIDYSKYKTINRGSPRQRPNVAQNEEKIDYTAIVRARKPVYDDDEESIPKSSTLAGNQPEIPNGRPIIKETDRSDASESRYEDLISSVESTTLTQRPSGHILQYRRRPLKSTTPSLLAEKSEKNLEILAPPIQTHRGTRPTTTTSSTNPDLEVQDPLTRLPTKRRRITTPRGYQPSVELVRTTEAVVRVYPENHRAKRVYRRQPVHIKTQPMTENFEELENAEDTTKLLRRRSERLSDVGQSSFIDPIYIDDGEEESIDREDRSIDQSGSIENQDHSKSKHKDVEIIKEYDKSKKHGGNLKKETEEDQEEIPAESEKKEDQLYILLRSKDKNMKQKFDKLPLEDKKSDQIAVPHKKEVDVIQKMSGNYKSKDDTVEDEVLRSDIEESKLVDNRDVNQENQEETSRSTVNKRLVLSFKNFGKNAHANTEIPQRLTDVVPKPDHFYTDPGLSNQVNQLRENKNYPTLYSQELEEIVTKGDYIYSSEDGPDRPVEEDKKIQDRIDIVDDSEDYREEDTISRYEDEEKLVPTKKPFFIKDPGKRLYYYAPV